MRAKTLGETRRMTVKLPARDVVRLAKLATKTGASSETEVIRQALYTYEKLADWLCEGAIFYAIDPEDGETWPVDFGIDVGTHPPHPKLKVTATQTVSETVPQAA